VGCLFASHRRTTARTTAYASLISALRYNFTLRNVSILLANRSISIFDTIARLLLAEGSANKVLFIGRVKMIMEILVKSGSDSLNALGIHHNDIR
jgi:hypothetical protein